MSLVLLQLLPKELANGLLSTNDKSSVTRSNDLKYVSPDDNLLRI